MAEMTPCAVNVVYVNKITCVHSIYIYRCMHIYHINTLSICACNMHNVHVVRIYVIFSVVCFLCLFSVLHFQPLLQTCFDAPKGRCHSCKSWRVQSRHKFPPSKWSFHTISHAFHQRCPKWSIPCICYDFHSQDLGRSHNPASLPGTRPMHPVPIWDQQDLLMNHKAFLRCKNLGTLGEKTTIFNITYNLNTSSKVQW